MTDWDLEADTFDDQPDHGLRAPTVRDAWARLLLPLVPAGSTVVDLGCGTGSLARLLADAGHDVTGVDSSPRMLELARAKVPAATFTLGDAATPPLQPGSVDVVLCRHVLWALPDPDAAVRTWVRLLRPGGRLLLVEGAWWTGGGLTADETCGLVLSHRTEAEVTRLDDPAYWGGPVSDERYLVLSSR